MNNDHVLVFVKSPNCGHCIKFNKLWNGETLNVNELKNDAEATVPVNPKRGTILESIKKNYPNMRTVDLFDVQLKSKMSKLPSAISKIRYNWAPLIFMVPGHIWNDAIRKKELNNEPNSLPGVQVISARVSYHDYGMNFEFDQSIGINIHDINSFMKWVSNTIKNPDFLNAVPKTNQKMIKEVVVESEPKTTPQESMFCFMNIIPRPLG